MQINKVVVSSLAGLAQLVAQVSTVRLEGRVTDTTGAVVPAVDVMASNIRTRVSARTTTSVEGYYTFVSLPAGAYTVQAEANGFRKAVVANLELNVGDTVTQNITLEVGAVTESITVEANVVRVQTADAQVARQVTLRDIDALPQLNRSPIIIAAFQPGVSINPADVTFSHVNGTRGGSNNAKLDGIDVNDSVVPRLGLSLTANNTDSVEEFRVVLNGGKAEYGRNAGAQIELITRSGTNQFHGNLYDFHRNTVLNANNWFNNASRVARPKFIQNLFGGAIGGPVRRDRTFFFFNYQGVRTSQDVVRNRTVLTPEARRGIFRWTAGGASQSFDIPRNDPRSIGIDRHIQTILALLPEPNNSDVGDGLNSAGFRFNNPSGASNDGLTFKIDHNLTSNHRLFYRHSRFRTESIDALNNADARFPGRPHGTQGGIRWGFSIGSDWTLTSTLVNEVRFGHQNASVDFRRPDRPKGPHFGANTWTDPVLPNFAQGRNSPVYDFTDNLTHLRAKHTIKAGFTFRRTLQYGYNDAGIYPNVTFGTTLGNAPPASVGPQGLPSADRQRFENLYNDLLGRPNQVTVTYYSDLEKFQPAGAGRLRNTVLKEWGGFLQDDWKLRPGLTFNIGLRWELFASPVENDGLQGEIDRAALVNTVSQVPDFRVRRAARWFVNDYNNFAPRFGFAWDPGNNGRFAIRGGYGIHYDRQIGATLSYVDGNTPGFSQATPVFPNQGGLDTRVAAGVPVGAQPAAPILQQPLTRATTIGAFHPRLRTGYVHHMSLNIQKEVLRNTVVDVGYVGTRGVKLFTWLDMNQPRIYGEFLQSFREIQAFRRSGAAPPAANTLVRIFGTPAAAVTNLGASIFDQGQAGAAADTLDRTFYTRYAAAGVSPFYLRNYPQYNQLVFGTNDGRSYYNSLQASFRRTTRDLMFFLNYTFSKSIDTISVDGNGFTAPIDNFNFRLNRARDDFDRPHVFNGSILYTLPIGSGKLIGGGLPRWASRLVGGWSLGALGVWQSGTVFTATSGRRTGPATLNAFANYSGDRKIGSLDIRPNGVFWFTEEQRARFTFPEAGETGTSGRNAFRGPSFMNWDMSVSKKFPIVENHTVTFRGEFFNLLNHANFGQPGLSIVTPASFGRISATAGGARIIQLALRYDF